MKEYRHRRGHGFESRSSLNYFQAFFSQLPLKIPLAGLHVKRYVILIDRSGPEILWTFWIKGKLANGLSEICVGLLDGNFLLETNVMVYFQPGEWMRMMYYSRKWHRHTRKKEIRVLLSGVEPKTFRLLVRMVYHWASGDSWELRPLN